MTPRHGMTAQKIHVQLPCLLGFPSHFLSFIPSSLLSLLVVQLSCLLGFPSCLLSFISLLVIPFYLMLSQSCHSPTLLILPLQCLVLSHLLTVSMSFHSVSLCFVSTCCISLHSVLCYLGLPFLCWYYSRIHSSLSPLLITRQVQLC